MNQKINAIWSGSFKKGAGKFTSENPLMNNMDFHFMKRANKNATLPEEFLAAAYSACFNMTMVMLLSKENYTIRTLDTDCTITYGADCVTGAELSLIGEVEEISADKFQELAKEAKLQCPVGKSFTFPAKLNIIMLK